MIRWAGQPPSSGEPVTGSIAIAHALLRGKGLAFVIIGGLLMLVSATVHANIYHVAAAAVFAVSIAGLRLLASIDEASLASRWRHIVHLTDRISLALLVVATFGPITILAMKGEPLWDIMALAGVLLVWWTVLRHVVGDYRRTMKMLVWFSLLWLPIAVLPIPDHIAAEATLALCIAAVAWSSDALRRTLEGLPRQYRKIDTSPLDEFEL